MSLDTQAVASAMDVHVMMQEIAARNVANLSTPGFKRNMALIESAQESGGDADGAPTIGRVGVDFAQGSLLPTHNDLDFAIKGKGFFVVETEDGSRYTRNGRFQMNEQREIVTQNGHRVMGRNGPLRVPEGSDRLEAGAAGDLRFGTESIGRFRVVNFERPELLRQAGNSEFTDEGKEAADALNFQVQHRFIEQSNVQPINELVRMIASLRDYEACARSLKSIGDVAGKLYTWAGS